MAPADGFVVPGCVLESFRHSSKNGTFANRAIDYSPSGVIAYASGSLVVIRDTLTDQTIQVLDQHKHTVISIKFTPYPSIPEEENDNTFILASMDQSGHLIIWNIAAGSIAYEYHDNMSNFSLIKKSMGLSNFSSIVDFEWVYYPCGEGSDRFILLLSQEPAAMKLINITTEVELWHCTLPSPPLRALLCTNQLNSQLTIVCYNGTIISIPNFSPLMKPDKHHFEDNVRIQHTCNDKDPMCDLLGKNAGIRDCFMTNRNVDLLFLMFETDIYLIDLTIKQKVYSFSMKKNAMFQKFLVSSHGLLGGNLLPLLHDNGSASVLRISNILKTPKFLFQHSILDGIIVNHSLKHDSYIFHAVVHPLSSIVAEAPIFDQSLTFITNNHRVGKFEINLTGKTFNMVYCSSYAAVLPICSSIIPPTKGFGERIILGNLNNELIVMDIKHRALLRRFLLPIKGANVVAITNISDPSIFIICKDSNSGDVCSCGLFNIDSGAYLDYFPKMKLSMTCDLIHVSDNGKYIAVSKYTYPLHIFRVTDDGNVRLVMVDSGLTQLTSMLWFRERLVAVSMDGSFRFFDMATFFNEPGTHSEVVSSKDETIRVSVPPLNIGYSAGVIGCVHQLDSFLLCGDALGKVHFFDLVNKTSASFQIANNTIIRKVAIHSVFTNIGYALTKSGHIILIDFKTFALTNQPLWVTPKHWRVVEAHWIDEKGIACISAEGITRVLSSFTMPSHFRIARQHLVRPVGTPVVLTRRERSRLFSVLMNINLEDLPSPKQLHGLPKLFPSVFQGSISETQLPGTQNHDLISMKLVKKVATLDMKERIIYLAGLFNELGILSLCLACSHKNVAVNIHRSRQSHIVIPPIDTATSPVEAINTSLTDQGMISGIELQENHVTIPLNSALSPHISTIYDSLLPSRTSSPVSEEDEVDRMSLYVDPELVAQNELDFSDFANEKAEKTPSKLQDPVFGQVSLLRNMLVGRFELVIAQLTENPNPQTFFSDCAIALLISNSHFTANKCDKLIRSLCDKLHELNYSYVDILTLMLATNNIKRAVDYLTQEKQFELALRAAASHKYNLNKPNMLIPGIYKEWAAHLLLQNRIQNAALCLVLAGMFPEALRVLLDFNQERVAYYMLHYVRATEIELDYNVFVSPVADSQGDGMCSLENVCDRINLAYGCQLHQAGMRDTAIKIFSNAGELGQGAIDSVSPIVSPMQSPRVDDHPFWIESKASEFERERAKSMETVKPEDLF
ncbi:hypothetical protein PCE1_004474 [Barthelona sp. PCE]